MKPLLRLLCVLTLSLAAGCGDACLSLAQQICNCQPDQVSIDACNQRAQTAEGIFPVRSQDEQYCQSRLDDPTSPCDCTKLNTAAGRAACGIAFQ